MAGGGSWVRRSRSRLADVFNGEALLVAGFAAANVALSVGANRLLTEVTPPKLLGDLYLFTNLALWLTLPTATGFVYVTHHWSIAREGGVTTRLMRGLAVGQILQGVIIVVGVGAMRLTEDLVATTSVAIALGLSALGTALAQAYGPIPAAERRRLLVGFLGLLGGPGRQIALAVGVILLSIGSASGLLWTQSTYLVAIGAATLGAAIIVHRATRSDGGTSISSRSQISLRAFLAYSAPNLVTVLATQLATTSERWGLARLQDTTATALFVQAIGLASAGTGSLGGVFTGYFYPLVTQAAAKGEDPIGAARKELRHFVGSTSVAMFVTTALGTVLAKPLLPLLFGSRFSGVGDLLPWAVAGAATFTVGQALTVVLFVGREPLWPNVARIVAQVAYAACLIAYRPAVDPALQYVRIYAAGQVLYVVLLLAAIAALRRRRSWAHG